MKKLIISAIIASALVGCGNEEADGQIRKLEIWKASVVSEGFRTTSSDGMPVRDKLADLQVAAINEAIDSGDRKRMERVIRLLEEDEMDRNEWMSVQRWLSDHMLEEGAGAKAQAKMSVIEAKRLKRFAK